LESVTADDLSYSYLTFKGYYRIDDTFYIYGERQTKTTEIDKAEKLIKEIPKLFEHNTLNGSSRRLNGNFCQYPRILAEKQIWIKSNQLNILTNG